MLCRSQRAERLAAVCNAVHATTIQLAHFGSVQMHAPGLSELNSLLWVASLSVAASSQGHRLTRCIQLEGERLHRCLELGCFAPRSLVLSGWPSDVGCTAESTGTVQVQPLITGVSCMQGQPSCFERGLSSPQVTSKSWQLHAWGLAALDRHFMVPLWTIKWRAK